MIHSHVSLLRVISLGAAVTFAAALGSGALFMAQHRTSMSESADGASRVFQQLREQFAHEEALLDMNERRPRLVTNVAIDPAPLHTVHTVIFDRRGGDRLVRMDMPYWLAGSCMQSMVTFNGSDNCRFSMTRSLIQSPLRCRGATSS